MYNYDDLQRMQNKRKMLYGDYKNNVDFRQQIMSQIIDFNATYGTRQFTEAEKVALSDVISKLARHAISPDYLDSLVDMEVYLNLYRNKVLKSNQSETTNTQTESVQVYSYDTSTTVL